MKNLFVFMTLSILCFTMLATPAFASSAPLCQNFASEIQLNQFRPHGGDTQEVSDMLKDLAAHPGYPLKLQSLLAANAADTAALSRYAAGLASYSKVTVVTTSVEKLYTVSGYDVYSNYRAIAKFKYLGHTADGKVIEKTDYLVLAKFGKNPTDWKLWGILWQDSGIDVSDVDLFQLNPPKTGEEICIMTTTEGVIKFRLFPAQTPRTVKNFKVLADRGYYNGSEFARTINDFMIQGGSPDGTTTSGDCIYGKYFEDELVHNLFNFRGALCMGNEGFANSNGNQFYIVQRKQAVPLHLDLAALPLNAEAKYREIGGCPHLDMRYTVFGQAFEGMDVVDRIAAKATDENDHPYQPVQVLSVEFVPYE